MQFHILALTTLIASASAGAVIPKVVGKIFGRDEVESMLLQARDASEAEWVGKIQNWMKPEPIGMSSTVKSILQKGGCQAPGGAKAKRSLDSEVSEIHMILTRNSNPVVKKADAWLAAQNPAALPTSIKKAFVAAGWSGTCVSGIKARGLDNEIDDFELYARDFDDEEFGFGL